MLNSIGEVPTYYIDESGNLILEADSQINLGKVVGKDGSQGEPGLQGPAGQDGTNGKSAYAYAQEGGFIGTEKEFASKLAMEYPTFDYVNEISEAGLLAIRSAAPVNLLDNSDFRSPVNQRNVTSWNYIGYGIDRWFTNGASANISVTRNGLQGSADFLVQRFEKTKLNGASKITAVVQVNGAIHFGVLNISNFTPGSDIVVITGIPGISRVNLYHENNDICQFYFAGLNSVTIEWAALYAGEYTAETLPEYRSKGYGVELAECLRYFERIDSGFGGCFMPSGAKYCEILVPCALKRIDHPTITINDGVKAATLSMSKCSDGSRLGSLWNASVTGYGYRRYVSVKFTTNDSPSQDCYVSLGGSSLGNFYIDISCDL